MVFSKLRWLVWLLFNSIPARLKEKWKPVIVGLVPVSENFKLDFIILNNFSWASCAIVDRISVRLNGTYKKGLYCISFV